MEQRLSLVTLGVKDLGQARRFYESGLGWKVAQPENEGVVFFQLPGIILALWDYRSLAEDANLNPDGKGFTGIALAYNTRSKNEVDSVLNTAEKAGGKILKTAKDTFWGGYSGYFQDPAGHVWEVAWNPFWTVTTDGRTVLGTNPTT